ncbi:MAG: type II toxin-antitoxin system HicA family toxin [Candidatus Thermoplasmatota archaeon]|nr:type II toxin-antitoxin system HicA family toxin [Candidatus Thermoplasmatota archaeon]
MVKLPRLSGHELIKILAQFGFKKIRQKGSHVMLIKGSGQNKIGCVVPCRIGNWNSISNITSSENH